MHVEEFKALKSQNLSSAILSNYPSLTFGMVQKLLRNKDIKINGKRVSVDIKIDVGDNVVFYINEMPKYKLDIIFEDENILVVFKKRKIETVSESSAYDLFELVQEYLKVQCFAVHRLDRNTEGLVVFAKNKKAKESLDFVFKNRTIEKYYLALVYGEFEKSSDNLVAYLKKFADKSCVDICSEKRNGYDKIQTNYKVLKCVKDCSLVEVKLVTGKTHQIRAHFAHIGHFVIGDEKYGDSLINKKFKCKFQNLCAYKIKFHFDKNNVLAYLNNKEIVLDKNKIDFCQNL